ncbi:MAG TPA: hypothetical protein VGP92_07460, partial [Acidimicrobiia bacterium]|nr:hypothetical protein [Acidimicrobiia bacterium]
NARRHRSRVVTALALVFVGACGSSTANRLPDIDALKCGATNGAPAPSPATRAALTRLGAVERAPLRGSVVHSGHGAPGPQSPVDVTGAAGRALVREITAAAQVACRLRTTEDAQRAGYVLSSNFTEGVGTHWTNWGLVDAPFDPIRPSMLLYGPRLGTTQLVGFSYWVRTSSPDGPAGFTGSADHWHRHYGMCFDRAGLLERENLLSAHVCAGTYVNGSDIWMLHAWVVPGAANVWGLFAPLNPQLCRRNVADIARCPGTDGS